jgi:hypothetical protein
MLIAFKRGIRSIRSTLENPIKKPVGVKKDKLNLCLLPPITSHESPIELVPKKHIIKQIRESRVASRRTANVS